MLDTEHNGLHNTLINLARYVLRTYKRHIVASTEIHEVVQFQLVFWKIIVHDDNGMLGLAQRKYLDPVEKRKVPLTWVSGQVIDFLTLI